MIKKKLLFILFAVFLSLYTPAVCSAAGNAAKDNIDVPNVFVYEKKVTKANRTGGLLFLFSSAVLDAQYDGYIVSFFSDIEITGEFHGNVYAFGSRVKIARNAVIDGAIHLLSADAAVAKGQIDGNLSVRGIGVFNLFLTARQTDAAILYSNGLPLLAFQAMIGALNICACMILFLIKKSFMQQGSVLLLEEPLEVIRNGIVVYFLIIGFILLFALTVFLIPLALIGFLVAKAMILVGQTALSLYIGYLITDALPFDKHRRGSLYTALRLSSFACMAIGVASIELLKLIPLIGLSVSFLFLPLIAIGMLVTAIANAFLRKIFYDTPYMYDNYKKDFDILEIRDIILK